MFNLIIAEDDAEDRVIFVDALRVVDPRIKIQLACNGDELMQLLEENIPDLVFLDLDMPCKNGLQCLHEIRTTARLRHLPVVIFSNSTKQSTINTAYEIGADLYFAKPKYFRGIIASLAQIIQLEWKNPALIRRQFHVNGRYLAFV